jgi:hypothetical protein
MFNSVRIVLQPPEGGGSFDLVFEPPGLFFVLAINAEETGIGRISPGGSNSLRVVLCCRRFSWNAIGKRLFSLGVDRRIGT